ncbi:MAG: hypothetical protein AB1689_05855 [Thermodesulfobacteriota bacterium]
MSKTYPWLTMALLLALAVVPAASGQAPATADEAELQVLLDTLRANRKAMVAVNLKLDDEQAARFWPLYDRYQKEISAIGDRILALIEEYEAQFHDLTDEKALQLTRDYLDAEAKRLEVKRTYLDEFARVLPGRTVARFYQIENKMDAVVRYDLAATIPVVEPAK